MKVFVLGGYGKTGLPAIKLLAQSGLVTEIAIVGRSQERAEKAAAEIGTKALAVQADGTDEQLLGPLLSGYDIVVNVATHEVVLPAIRAAARAGVHYCDAATFGDLVAQVLPLASEAKAAGITAVIAAGISPHLSNLLGVHVARQLEDVEQIQIGRADIFDFQTGRELTPRQWRQDPKESLAALKEFRPFIAWTLQRLQEEGGRTVRVYRNGQWEEMDPIEDGLDVPWGQGGRTATHPVFSGDDAWGMLPHDLSAASPVELWFGPFPPGPHALLREQALRLLGGHIDAEAAVGAFYETIESDPWRWLTAPADFAPFSKMWVRALGRKEGRAARCTCWFTAPMWDVGGYYLTSVALAVAVLKILRSETREPGVMTAEKAFEPLPFLDEVASLLPDALTDGRMIHEAFEWLA